MTQQIVARRLATVLIWLSFLTMLALILVWPKQASSQASSDCDWSKLARLEAAEHALRAGLSRWLQRVSYHLWRIQHHVNRMREAGEPASALREAAVEVLQD